MKNTKNKKSLKNNKKSLRNNKKSLKNNKKSLKNNKKSLKNNKKGLKNNKKHIGGAAFAASNADSIPLHASGVIPSLRDWRTNRNTSKVVEGHLNRIRSWLYSGKTLTESERKKLTIIILFYISRIDLEHSLTTLFKTNYHKLFSNERMNEGDQNSLIRRLIDDTDINYSDKQTIKRYFDNTLEPGRDIWEKIYNILNNFYDEQKNKVQRPRHGLSPLGKAAMFSSFT